MVSLSRASVTYEYALGILKANREKLVERAQEIVDTWDWDSGGACDAIADEFVDILADEYLDAYSHHEIGGDHTWVVVPVEGDVIEVDIPWTVYEETDGYNSYSPTLVEIELYDLLFTRLHIDPSLLALGLV